MPAILARGSEVSQYERERNEERDSLPECYVGGEITSQKGLHHLGRVLSI